MQIRNVVLPGYYDNYTFLKSQFRKNQSEGLQDRLLRQKTEETASVLKFNLPFIIHSQCDLRKSVNFSEP